MRLVYFSVLFVSNVFAQQIVENGICYKIDNGVRVIEDCVVPTSSSPLPLPTIDDNGNHNGTDDNGNHSGIDDNGNHNGTDDKGNHSGIDDNGNHNGTDDKGSSNVKSASNKINEVGNLAALVMFLFGLM
jgi:hypothetical protein